MDLSIVIVNYNVKHFLVQCLYAIKQASQGLNVEVIVVDNASSDGSQDEVNSRFPWVQYIYNTRNVGFGRANNQGIKLAKGRYTLLLNPDTIIQEDSLKKCVTYLDDHTEVGGLGIKMIDGYGSFLPESKRSFPSPQVAFFKLFGLAQLFPKSPYFGRYHLGYLDREKNHQVDVLSGAFFMSPTALLQDLGGFDERYFMYGEDIDLSFQIEQAGYHNVYFAESFILHYKGESTKKGSLNYVRQFYQAMILFVKKNLSQKEQRFLLPFLQFAIFFRASLTIISQWFKKITLPFFDALLSYVLMLLSAQVWLDVKMDFKQYPMALYSLNYPLYIIGGLLGMYLSGAYDKPYRGFKIIRGSFFGLLIISLIYTALPGQFNFSRMLVLFSVISIGMAVFLVRWVSQYLRHGAFSFYGSRKRNFIVIGAPKSLQIKETLLNKSTKANFFGLVTVQPSDDRQQIGLLDDLKDIINNIHPTDLIFDVEEVSFKNYLDFLNNQDFSNIRIYSTYDKGRSLIRNYRKNENSQIIDFDDNYQLSLPGQLRNKRLFDIFSSIILLALAPIMVFVVDRPLQYIRNTVRVLLGKKTWVGYSSIPKSALPPLNASILTPSGVRQKKYHSDDVDQDVDKRYAQYYRVAQDLDVLLNNLRHL